jgi:hypothetical protein
MQKYEDETVVIYGDADFHLLWLCLAGDLP